MESFTEMRDKLLENGAKLEIASRDITFEMQNYLEQIHAMCGVFK